MTVTRKARRPSQLGVDGGALWDRVTRQLADDGLELDARETALLTEACRAQDELGRLQAALQDAPTVTLGSQGQERVHPLFSEVRAARAQVAALLAQVDLRDPAEARPGSGSRTTSASARAAVAVRWAKPRSA